MNYYSGFSYIIPCTFAQAAMAASCLDMFTDDGIDAFATEALKLDPSEVTSARQKIIRSAYTDSELKDTNNHGEFGEWDFDYEPVKNGFHTEEGLLIFSSDGASEDHLNVVAAILDAYGINTAVEVDFGFYADRPEPGAFGGSSVVVHRSGVYFSDYSFKSTTKTALERGERYFRVMVYFPSDNPDNPSDESRLVTVQGHQTFEACIRERMEQFECFDETGPLTFTDSAGRSCSINETFEVTPEEFAVLEKHIQAL